jgi:hypothetical protein
LDYDDEVDVLYASVGPAQRALCVEVEPDILLRYVPPRPNVVGLTVMDFLAQFPQPPETPFEAHARGVVRELLHKYPTVPGDRLPAEACRPSA